MKRLSNNINREKHIEFRIDLPKLSIITPSFNQGRFIEDTILSVKNQNYPNFEHIIIDGNSIDDTIKILKDYDSKYNLAWISENDRGQADAINKGFKMAKGEIIGWLNSDDIYPFDNIFLNVAMKFHENKEIDVIYGDNIYIDENNLFLGYRKMLPWSYARATRGTIPSQPSVFFRKKVIDKFKLDINLNYAMDLHFWLNIGKEFKFMHINGITSADRLHSKTKRSTLNEIGKKEKYEICKSFGQNYNFYYYILHYFIDYPLLLMWRIYGAFAIILLDFSKAIVFKPQKRTTLLKKQIVFISKGFLGRIRHPMSRFF